MMMILEGGRVRVGGEIKSTEGRRRRGGQLETINKENKDPLSATQHVAMVLSSGCGKRFRIQIERERVDKRERK